MKRYGIAAALVICLLASWNSRASDSSQPSGQLDSSAVRESASDTPASPGTVATAAAASEATPSSLVFSSYEESSMCRDLHVVLAAAHTYRDLSTQSQNATFPVDGSAVKGIGVPIDLGNNWTLRPWINFGMPGCSQSGDTAKPLGRAMLGMSLSCSF